MVLILFYALISVATMVDNGISEMVDIASIFEERGPTIDTDRSMYRMRRYSQHCNDVMIACWIHLMWVVRYSR